MSPSSGWWAFPSLLIGVCVVMSNVMPTTNATACMYSSSAQPPAALSLSSCDGYVLRVADVQIAFAISLTIDVEGASVTVENVTTTADIVITVSSVFSAASGGTPAAATVVTIRNCTFTPPTTVGPLSIGGSFGTGSRIMLDNTSSTSSLLQLTQNFLIANNASMVLRNLSCGSGDASTTNSAVLCVASPLVTIWNTSTMLITGSRVWRAAVSWSGLVIRNGSTLLFDALTVQTPAVTSGTGYAALGIINVAIELGSIMAFIDCTITASGTPLYLSTATSTFQVTDGSALVVRGGRMHSSLDGLGMYLRNITARRRSTVNITATTFIVTTSPQQEGAIHIAQCTGDDKATIELSHLNITNTGLSQIILLPIVELFANSTVIIAHHTWSGGGTFAPDSTGSISAETWTITQGSTLTLRNITADVQGSLMIGRTWTVTSSSTVQVDDVKFSTYGCFLAVVTAIITGGSSFSVTGTRGTSTILSSLIFNGTVNVSDRSRIHVQNNSWTSVSWPFVSTPGLSANCVVVGLANVSSSSTLAFVGNTLAVTTSGTTGLVSLQMRDGAYVDQSSGLHFVNNSAPSSIAICGPIRASTSSFVELFGTVTPLTSCFLTSSSSVLNTVGSFTIEAGSHMASLNNNCGGSAVSAVAVVKVPRTASVALATAHTPSSPGLTGCDHCNSTECPIPSSFMMVACPTTLSAANVRLCDAACPAADPARGGMWGFCGDSVRVCLCLWSAGGVCTPIERTATMTMTNPCTPLTNIRLQQEAQSAASLTSVYIVSRNGVTLRIPLGATLQDVRTLRSVASTWGRVSNPSIEQTANTSLLVVPLSYVGGGAVAFDVAQAATISVSWSTTTIDLVCASTNNFTFVIPGAGLPTPLAAREAAQSAVLASMAIAAAAPSVVASSLGSLQRSLLILRLTACQFGSDDPPPISDSPLQLSIGDDDSLYDRGTVVGNLIVGVAFFLATWTVAIVEELRHTFLSPSSLKRDHQRHCRVGRRWRRVTGMPGKLAVVVLALGQPTVAAVYQLVPGVSDEPKLNAAPVVVAVAVMAGFIAHVAWALLFEFPLRPYRRKPLTLAERRKLQHTSAGASHRRIFLCLSREWFEREYEWDPSESHQGRPRSSSSTSIWPDSPLAAAKSEELQTFFDGYSEWFEDYKPERKWYMLVDLATFVATGVIAAQEPDTQAGCQVLSGITCGVSIALLVCLLVLRPFACPFDSVGALRDNAMVALAAVLAAAGRGTEADVVSMLQAYLAIVCIFLPMGIPEHKSGFLARLLCRSETPTEGSMRLDRIESSDKLIATASSASPPTSRTTRGSSTVSRMSSPGYLRSRQTSSLSVSSPRDGDQVASMDMLNDRLLNAKGDDTQGNLEALLQLICNLQAHTPSDDLGLL